MDFLIGVTNIFHNLAKASRFPTNFPNEMILNRTDRTILKCLESRSLPNNGDTKIYDSRLAKITGYSVRTVERSMQKLDKHKFISRMTIRKFDKKRYRSDIKGCFYSIRVVRCNRVLLARRFHILTQKELGWKTDSRTIVPINKTNITAEWLTPVEHIVFENGKTKTITPKWRNYIELSGMGLFDLSVLDLRRALEDRAYCGDPIAINILGFANPIKHNDAS